VLRFPNPAEGSVRRRLARNELDIVIIPGRSVVSKRTSAQKPALWILDSKLRQFPHAAREKTAMVPLPGQCIFLSDRPRVRDTSRGLMSVCFAPNDGGNKVNRPWQLVDQPCKTKLGVGAALQGSDGVKMLFCLILCFFSFLQ